jgi:N-acetylmuramoyl-L-alanine amidase
LHRSATNLCIITIVNAALHDNPNIHFQAGSGAGMRSQDRGQSRPRQAVATGSQCWSPARKWLVGAVVAIMVGAAGPALRDAGAAEASVDDIRIASHGDATRVVIDLSEPVSYRYISLGKPPRLAIDMPDVDWTVGQDASRTVGLIKGFRFGQPRPGVSRIVLDVAQPFAIDRMFELPPNGTRGHRIVTDLVEKPVNGQHHQFDDVIAPAAAPGDTQAAAMVVIGPPARKPPPPPAEEPTIVIDPGHGGVDPGAIGSTTNILEKEVALRMGLALRDTLEATGRYKVIMTRYEDTIVRLRDRLQIARQSEGELFISLHADSLVRAPDVRGASVYTLSERASNDEAARLARKENRADILAGVDLSDQADVVTEILIDLAQRDANNKSVSFAELLVEELKGATRMARRGRAQAGFVVLKSPDMPSVLIELGYLSNAADEKALADDAHIARLAAAVAQAVDVYFGVGPS